MNIQKNDLSVTRKSLVVTLDPAEVEAEHKAVVAEITRHAQLPGFRPGKAPQSIVLKRFAKEVADEFKQKVVTKAYRAGVDAEKLDIVAVVKVDDGKIELGQQAVITVVVDIQPKFELPEYNGLPTTIHFIDPSEAEVEKVLEGMRAERASFTAVTREAQKGDYVKLAYEGSIDGKPIADLAPDKQIYAKVPQTWEEVDGENEGLLPGLSRQLAGLKTGDKKEVTIAFPAEFPAVPALAGKSAVYALDIQEVRERVLPELNEEFFKANQAENLEGLKKSIQDNLRVQKEMQNRNSQRRQVIDALVAKADFALPESLVESETQGVLRNFIEENMRRGVPQEQFEKDKKELFASARQAAELRVKSQLMLAQVAQKEKIEIVERDFDTYVYREAMRTGEKPDRIVKSLAENRELLQSVQRAIIFDKAVDFLVSKATVTTVEAKS